MMKSLGKIKKVDFYRQVHVDLTEPTAPGAIISVVAVTIMTLLFLGEVRSYFDPPSRSDMFVASDEDEAHHLLKVNFNMTFHKLPCFVASFDVMDVLGRHAVNVQSNTKKTRISADGVSLGDFDSQQDKEELYSSMVSEGCNLDGFVLVHKVPGNFHISAHGLQERVNKYLGGAISVAHTIHHLHFGEQELKLDKKHGYEGHVHPLNGAEHREEGNMYYEYFLDIVPTVYTYKPKRGQSGVERGYQYTSSMHALQSPNGYMAAVFFQYQISPITVSYSFERSSFSHFLTYTCAIIGGVFTVAGILSRAIHASALQLQKRVRGKDI